MYIYIYNFFSITISMPMFCFHKNMGMEIVIEKTKGSKLLSAYFWENQQLTY